MALVAVAAPDECWYWRGSINPVTGYGQLATTKGTLLAHRLVYRLLVGPIPPGGQLDHLCRNRPCVNPAHLEVVTNRENQLRTPHVIAARARTLCLSGHELTPENVYYRPSGRRECRECKRESVRQWRRRKAAA